MFLAELNSTGTARVWGTYYGGIGNDIGDAIKIDHAGNLLIGGTTGNSTGLATAGAYQTQNAGGTDVLIAKFSPTGSRLWATYYGGTINESFTAITHGLIDVDENNNVFAALNANSPGLGSNCSYQPAIYTSPDYLLLKLTADGSSRIWSTYWGGSSSETTGGIRYLGNSQFLVAGTSLLSATGLATAGAYQYNNAGGIGEGLIGLFTEATTLPLNLAVSASSIAPLTQNACTQGQTQSIIGNTVTITMPSTFISGIFYQWQTAPTPAGPWTDIAAETFKDLTPSAGSSTAYFRRLVKVNSSYCNLTTVDSSAVATVNVSANTAPTVSADGPNWFVCPSPNTITFNGTGTPVLPAASISSYAWYAGSNPVPVAATASYTPTNIATATTYTLEVTDNNGCVGLNQVTVTPIAANAGSAASFCQGTSGVQIGTAPVSSPSIAYAWTTVSGTPAATALSCLNCAQPIASPLVTSVYQLTVSVTQKGGAICTSTSNVTVTPVQAPTII